MTSSLSKTFFGGRGDDMRSNSFLYLAGVAIVSALSIPVVGQTAEATIESEGAAASATVKLQPAPKEYVIGPDDVLAVNVWKEPEISRTLPVRPDGNISLPLMGDLMASGRTPVQLQKEIKDHLEAKSHKFNIIGEVEKPGSYLMAGPMTVLDAIALAGGVRDFARTTKIYVLRVNADGSRTRLPFNYKHVIKGNDLRADVQLQTRDTIVVP
jgi:polysaccharide export outer membrane protein